MNELNKIFDTYSFHICKRAIIYFFGNYTLKNLNDSLGTWDEHGENLGGKIVYSIIYGRHQKIRLLPVPKYPSNKQYTQISNAYF